MSYPKQQTTTHTTTYTQATGILSDNVNGVVTNTDLSCLKSNFNGLTVTNPITTCFKGYGATKMVRDLRVTTNGVDACNNPLYKIEVDSADEHYSVALAGERFDTLNTSITANGTYVGPVLSVVVTNPSACRRMRGWYNLTAVYNVNLPANIGTGFQPKLSIDGGPFNNSGGKFRQLGATVIEEFLAININPTSVAAGVTLTYQLRPELNITNYVAGGIWTSIYTSLDFIFATDII